MKMRELKNQDDGGDSKGGHNHPLPHPYQSINTTR